MHSQIGNQIQQVVQGPAGVQGFQVAGRVVTDIKIERAKVRLQLALAPQLFEIGSDLDRLRGHDFDVGVIEQHGVLVLQTERGCRFGANDWHALASEFGQFPDVPLGQFAGCIQVPGRDHGHSRDRLSGRHVDGHVVVVQNGHQSRTQFGVVVVGEVINKIDNRPFC